MRRTTVALGTCCLAATALPVLGTSASAAPAELVKPLASGVQPYDFDGDGYVDVAVGAPGEDFKRDGKVIKNAGVVDVVYGSAAGLDHSRTQEWSLDSPRVPGKAKSGDFFGAMLTSGDYNGDGYADLVAGIQGRDSAGHDRGAVTVVYGSATGLTSASALTTTMSDKTRPQAHLGASLTTGDFNGDSVADLAVGAPGIQKVTVVLGHAGAPLDFDQATWWSDKGLQGVRLEDTFGFYLAAGDTNHDGFDELAIADPYDYQDQGWLIGAVTVVRGTENGLVKTGATRWTEDTPGLKGASHNWPGKAKDKMCDCFGYQVALGDVTGDGYADLLVSAPGVPVKRNGVKHQDAGVFYLIPGSAQGITTKGNQRFSQDSPGIPGKATTGRTIGNTITLGDLDGDGVDEMALAGGGMEAVLLFPGGSTFGRHASAWSQDTPGVPGRTTSRQDDFAAWIRFSAITGTSQKQLLVGADGKRDWTGALLVFDSVGTTLDPHAEVVTQDSPGIKGKAEKGDGFGVL